MDSALGWEAVQVVEAAEERERKLLGPGLACRCVERRDRRGRELAGEAGERAPERRGRRCLLRRAEAAESVWALASVREVKEEWVWERALERRGRRFPAGRVEERTVPA